MGEIRHLTHNERYKLLKRLKTESSSFRATMRLISVSEFVTLFFLILAFCQLLIPVVPKWFAVVSLALLFQLVDYLKNRLLVYPAAERLGSVSCKR